MKRALLLSVMVALATLVVAGTVWAQDNPPAGERPARGERPAGGERGPGGMRGMFADPMAQKTQFDKAVDGLTLTAEVKEKVAGIRKDFATKIEEASAAMKKEDATREERMAARQKVGAVVKEYTDAVKAALPEDARKKVEEAMVPPIAGSVLLKAILDNAEALKLTEEQTKSIKALAEEYKPAENDMRGMMEKMQAIRTSDKTDEEKRKETQALQAEMQKQREAQMAKDKECAEKVAKILNADQMKQAKELAAKAAPAGRRPGRERPTEQKPAETKTETKPTDSSAPKPDGLK
jgi:hypothetical protein